MANRIRIQVADAGFHSSKNLKNQRYVIDIHSMISGVARNFKKEVGTGQTTKVIKIVGVFQSLSDVCSFCTERQNQKGVWGRGGMSQRLGALGGHVKN